MANLLKMEIRNREFINVDCEDNLIVKIKPRHIIANGWDCRIFGNGKIYCETREAYSDGEHFMKFVINPNGSYHLKLRRPNQKSIILKKGWATKSIKEVCLSDGYLDDRLAYFVQN